MAQGGASIVAARLATLLILACPPAYLAKRGNLVGCVVLGVPWLALVLVADCGRCGHRHGCSRARPPSSSTDEPLEAAWPRSGGIRQDAIANQELSTAARAVSIEPDNRRSSRRGQ